MAYVEKPPSQDDLNNMWFMKPKNCARLINRSVPYVYKLISNGRLRFAGGLVEKDHLIDQARKGFPVLED